MGFKMIEKENKGLFGSKLETKPLVSVIVPTYNRSSLISETIEAILEQIYSNFELVVISDGSSDDTDEVVESYVGQKVSLVRIPHCGFPARPRNYGIRKSSGKYIAFCDDDDLWLPDKLDKQVEFMERNPGVGLCSGYAIEVDQFGEVLYVPPEDKVVYKEFDFDQLIRTNYIKNSTTMVRRTCLEKVGMFDEAPNFRAIEDYDLWLRIAWQYRVVQVPFMLAKTRRHSGNISRSKVGKCINWLKVLQKHEDIGYVDSKTLNLTRGVVYRRLFIRMNLQRDSGARRYALKAVKSSFNFLNYMCFCISLLPQSWAFHILVLLLKPKLSDSLS